MKKIIITGVAGFIGSNLAAALVKKRYRIIGIDNLSYGIKEQIPQGVLFHKLDIRSKRIYGLFKGVDTVFHLAAKNCINDCQQNPQETADINITGTVNVFEAARVAKVRKIIYAESSAIYEGSSFFPTPEREEKPISFYACSKLAVNHFARSFIATYGMHITGLRYFNVYGPRQDYRRSVPPVMPAFIIALLKDNRPIIYGTGEKRRDFIYIDDVNGFHLKAIDDDRTNGNIYNLGSGKNYSVNEIYCLIKNLLKKNITPLYRDDFPFEAEITLADIHKAKKIGWHPKVGVEEGLKKLIDYIKENVIKERR
jgi:nucleoside-diphosphate-sugar epimerase